MDENLPQICPLSSQKSVKKSIMELFKQDGNKIKQIWVRDIFLD